MASDDDVKAHNELMDLLNFTNAPGFTYNPLKGDTFIDDAVDPFIGTPQQTSRMRAYCKILVNGLDVTDKLEPHLISVHVVITEPTGAADIELDDRDGVLPLPPIGAPISISLGWETEQIIEVFLGWIEDLEHGFGRKQGGRRMYIHAKGWDAASAIKQPAQNNLGEGAKPGQKEGEMHGLPEWLNKLSGTAGISASITGALGKIKSDYWHHANSSLMHEVATLSKRYGFTYRFTGGPLGKELHIENPSERGLSCTAVWRDNLIGWRVKPINLRSAFGGATQQSYDHKKAGWNTQLQKFGITAAPIGQIAAIVGAQAPSATDTDAGNVNEAAQTQADSTVFGNGRIMINGEPKAVWNSKVLLVGARPGVDGLYGINVVEHVYSRQGFITTLEVTTIGSKFAGNYSAFRSWLPKAQPNIGGAGSTVNLDIFGAPVQTENLSNIKTDLSKP